MMVNSSPSKENQKSSSVLGRTRRGGFKFEAPPVFRYMLPELTIQIYSSHHARNGSTTCEGRLRGKSISASSRFKEDGKDEENNRLTFDRENDTVPNWTHHLF